MSVLVGFAQCCLLCWFRSRSLCTTGFAAVANDFAKSRNDSANNPHHKSSRILHPPPPHPASLQIVEERLIKRGSETESNRKVRLETAREEMAYLDKFAYWTEIVYSDDLDIPHGSTFKQLMRLFVEDLGLEPLMNDDDW